MWLERIKERKFEKLRKMSTHIKRESDMKKGKKEKKYSLIRK